MPRGLRREIHVDQRHRFFFKQQIEHLRNIRLERREISVPSLSLTTVLMRDAVYSEQCGLFCSRQGAGMPAGIAEIQTEIDSRKNDIDMLPMMRSERNAIGWSTIHPIGFEVTQANPLVPQRP